MRYKILAILLILAIVGLSIFCENSVKKVNNKNLKKISKMETKTDFKEILPFVIGWEGGLSDRKADTGGLTNRGITYKTYLSLCRKVYGVDPTKEHFLNLNYKEVSLMIEYFWNKATFNNSIKSQKVAESIFNWLWGSGTLGLVWFQYMLNKEFKTKLVVDGIIGENSIAAINSINPDELFRMSLIYRCNRFHKICEQNYTQYANLRGWINRLNDFAKRHGEKGNFVAVMK